MVSGCCKEVYRYPHITYPYSICISSFFAAESLLLCSFLNVFVLVYVIFVQYGKRINVAQRTFEIVQKSRSRGHGNIIISTMDYEYRDLHM